MKPMSLADELKRRRVFRALVAYGLVAFAILQVAEPVMHGLRWPDAVLSWIVVALAIGFPVVIAVAWALDLRAPDAASPSRLRGARLVAAVCGIGALAAAPGLLWHFIGRAALKGPSGADLRRIAVLALADPGARPEDRYFADGMTQELISALARVPELSVIADSSVRNLAIADAASAGRELEAGSAVEGTIRRDGPRLRISVRLVRTSDRVALWSQDYDRALQDAFAVQAEVARRIAEALQLRLATPERAPARRDPEAQDAYLRALYLLATADTSARPLERQTEAIAALRRTIEIEPSFAVAHAKLASTYALRFFVYREEPEVEQAAWIEVEKALALDPDLAEAHVARANLTWTLRNHFPHEIAVAELRRAVALQPSLPSAHQSLGSIYLHVGLFDKALAELQVVLRLDPADTFALPRIARIDLLKGDYARALAEFGDRPASQPERALALHHLGRDEAALAALQRAAPLDDRDGNLDAVRAVVQASLHRRKEAEASIAEALRRGAGVSHFHHSQYWIATAWALLGERGKAVESLRHAAEDGFPCLPAFERDPDLAGLRDDPGFGELLGELRLRYEHYRATL